jgi:uncharacterized OsmC-like protein
MVRIFTEYTGEKRCELTHGPSHSIVQTDAPKDNNGKGELFSPTDLLAAATVSCMLTVIGIHAEKDGLNIDGAKATVDKEMALNPRRVAKLHITLQLPKALTAEQRDKFEALALNCPVKQSLSKEMQTPVVFTYDL